MYFCECACHSSVHDESLLSKDGRMTTLSVYSGWTKVPIQDGTTAERYMGGFRIIYPDKFDVTVACENVFFDTPDEAVAFATRNAEAYLSLLEVFDIISSQAEVTWEDISPPN
jgi:hypothetical protein